MSSIYFLKRPDGDIKIETTRQVNVQLSQLIDQHGDLILLGMMQGADDEERLLRRQFAQYQRAGTEFFAPAPELLQFIHDKAKPVLKPEDKQKRRPRLIDASNEIKAVARRHMTNSGTASLSLRAIAAEMGITAPAIYRYFENRDALITDLIVDAFNALADALEQTRDSCSSESPVERLVAVLKAYRNWALAHPTDFQLIYGNPIPGYVAPREVTVPAVIRSFAVIVGLLEQALKGRTALPAVPAALVAHFRAMIADGGYPVSEAAFYWGIVCWTQGHGIIMLELFNHLPPTVGNVDVYYQAQIDLLLRNIGI
jgi:AcrR family transcriptional regulator